MTTDIVERLRADADRGWLHPGVAVEAAAEIELLLEETKLMRAALRKQSAEIERLTVTLEACQAALRDAMSSSTEWMEETERLRAAFKANDEIERLLRINEDHCRAVNTLTVVNSQQADEIEQLRALLRDRPRDDGTVLAVGGEPGASAGKSE